MKQERLIQAFFYNNPDNYPPIINGIRLLSEAGWRVQLFCRDDGKQWSVQYPDIASIHRIKPTGNNSWVSYSAFIAKAMKLRSRNATAFIAHDMHALIPARLLATRYRRPLIYHCYDYSGNGYAQTLSGRIVRGFQSAFAKSARVVTVPDPGLADIVHKDLHLLRRPFVVANSPIDVPEKRNGSLHGALLSHGFEFEKILFRPGRIGPGHAIEATIRSIPHWASKKWGFAVMGIAEDSYVKSLNTLATSLGVEKQFAALPPVSYDEVHKFTADADVGHALYEPIDVNNLNISGSCKIQEYMAAGLPLLVSRQESLRGILDRYSCGLVVDERVPKEIAVVLNDIFSDCEKARSMGFAAAKAFEKETRFSRQFDCIIRALETINDAMLSRK